MPANIDSPTRLKFSLRFLLVAFVGLGVVGGVLGRLFFRNLEIFLVVVGLLSTVLPFLFAIGTIIWIGMRGQGRQRWLVVWGVMLLVMPGVGLGTMFVLHRMLGPSPSNLRTLSTQQVTQQQLPNRIDSLDSSIRSADIILTPNPSHIEQRPEVSEIWGSQTTLRRVPIERLDLEVGQ